MMGPNTVSGHLSVIYTTECQINFAIRLLTPLLRALQASRSALPSIRAAHDVVSVKPEAEQRDIDDVQDKAKRLVWASGCTSWFIHGKSKRNTSMFPAAQYKFWMRSVFIPWGDFEYRASEAFVETSRGTGSRATALVLSAITGIAMGSVAYLYKLHR
jgi:hypothetical protein